MLDDGPIIQEDWEEIIQEIGINGDVGMVDLYKWDLLVGNIKKIKNKNGKKKDR